MRRRRPRNRLRVAFRVVALAVLVGFAAVLSTPVGREVVPRANVVPLPGHVPGAVDFLVWIIQAIRSAAPYVAVAAIVAHVFLLVDGRLSSRARLLNRLSRTEYRGVEHSGGSRKGPTLSRGAGLAVLAVVLVGATSGIEREVSEGPLRPIAALTDLAPDGDLGFVLQSPGITFMDDSSIEPGTMARLVESSKGNALPFGKYLFNIDGLSAIQISIPDDRFDALVGGPEPTSCNERRLVMDNSVGARVGDRVEMNGAMLTVAKVEPDIAQMNRHVGIVADSTVRDCVQHGTATGFFGALVVTPTPELEQAVTDAGLALVPEHRFLENNRDFWRANATPLLLQLILYLTLFAAFAAAGARQSELQRNVREIGMLNAGGVTFGTLLSIEIRRALRTCLWAGVLAAAPMVAVAAAFNASELGVQIAAGLTEWSVGVVLVLIAMLAASWRSLSTFRRTLELPLAVKG